MATEGICPFKGLASFEPVDAEYVFGRERLVAELVARLVGAGFLGIVGPSGSGKSSVLRAGLLPALAGGVVPGSEGWRRLLLRPGEHPLEELRRVLVSGASDPLAEALDTLPRDARLLVAVARLAGAAAALRDAVGVPWASAYDRERIERELSSIRSALGEDAFLVAYEEGQAIDAAKAARQALASLASNDG